LAPPDVFPQNPIPSITIHQQAVTARLIEHRGIAPPPQLKTDLESGISNSNK